MATAAATTSSTPSAYKNMSHHHHHHHHHPHSNRNSDNPPSSDSNPNLHSSQNHHRSSSRKSKRGGARPQRLQSRYRSKFAVWLEPRLLKIATAVTIFGVVLQLIAISTNNWLILEASQDIYKNSTGKFLLEAHTGLWRLCRKEVERTRIAGGKLEEKIHERCESHNLFPSRKEREDSKDYDRQYLDYTRTAIAFTIIALVITVIGHCFAFYALRRPRYIIKRLAALLHFMTAACLLVLNEVFIKTVEHERENMPGRIPKNADTYYGFSFVLSWLVFVFFVLAGLVFLFSSHKRKAEYADGSDALEDEPMEIFRR